MTGHEIQRVALALVRRADTWLVAQRPARAHLGGLWEFPGGKLERGETPAAAALRELHEECGVSAIAVATLPSAQCDYGDRVVELTPVLCVWEAGEPRPLGNQACRWVATAELRQLTMPPINARIIALAMEVAEGAL